MRLLIHHFCATLALLCMAGLQSKDECCAADTPPSNATNDSSAGASTDNTVRRLTLPHIEPVMPFLPGRDEFMRACVGCHSPRYVTMQPPFSRHQWEETAHKMINAYGTPADEAQVGKIIDYLYAIDGDGPRTHIHDPSSDDDDFGATPSVTLPEATESAPVFEPAASVEEHEMRLRRGAEVFAEDCAGCHGDDGRGDGVVSEVLLPRPTNLTVARFSNEFLRQTLWNGVRGAPMPSWRKLPVRDLSALSTYVQSLHSTADSGPVAPESLAQGSALFVKNCVPCHGSTGDGKGPQAATLAPPPSNFKHLQPDLDYIQKVLRDGIPGTAMPMWKDQLSESDRAALASYVRSLFELPK